MGRIHYVFVSQGVADDGLAWPVMVCHGPGAHVARPLVRIRLTASQQQARYSPA